MVCEKPLKGGRMWNTVLILMMVFMVSCGGSGDRGATGSTGSPGAPGQDGADGESPYIYYTVDASSIGTCYQVSDTVWVENENHEIDVYNNDDCDHGPSPKYEYCDDFVEHQTCGVDGLLIWFQGVGSDMVLHIVDFNEEE